jgi:thiosulfate/3-mercaptopyruvate sulfurtransferase
MAHATRLAQATRRQEMLVDTVWLARHLREPGIRLVDCRFSFDYPAEEDYRRGHIPGAVYLDWSRDITDQHHPVRMMLAPPDKFARAMERLGIGDDMLVIAYDQDGGHYAARLWLGLLRYGHGPVKLLDGGIVAWEREGRPLTAEVPVIQPARFTVRPPLVRVATVDDILAGLERKDTMLLDVRRHSEFTGEECRAARGGRIPGAVHVHWQETVPGPDKRVLPDAALHDLYTSAGVTPERPVITYCQGGVRAAHTAFVLTMLGYPDVAVYDGSWEEWGNRPDLPIEAGEERPRGSSG